MTTITSSVNEFRAGADGARVVIVEAPSRLARRRWLEDRAEELAGVQGRSFRVSADFDS